MVTLTPERAALLEEIERLERRRPDRGGLVGEGSDARLARLSGASEPARAARKRLAARVRGGAVDQDVQAAVASSASASGPDRVLLLDDCAWALLGSASLPAARRSEIADLVESCAIAICTQSLIEAEWSARRGALHDDRDYDLLAELTSPDFESQWLAAAGTLP